MHSVQKFVFAYGSLLNENEARKVFSAKSWNMAVPALLIGYRRIYNKWSTVRHGCVLNVEPSNVDSVLGLLFGPLNRSEIVSLAKRELWGVHYDYVVVMVEKLLYKKKMVKAVTSVAKKPFIRGTRISRAYERIVRAGVESLSIKFQMPQFLDNYESSTYNPQGRKIY
jgi:hypothetical protein